MKLHIVTYAYALSDAMIDTFNAANGPDVTWHLFLHSQRPPVIDACELLATRGNVRYYPHGTDRGLARSFNEGAIAAQAAGADVVAQLCDDMLSEPGDVRRMAEMVLDNPDYAYVDGRCYVERNEVFRPSGFDACAISLKAIETIGYMDVNCWPVNFEDVDWKRRAMLAGYEYGTFEGAQLTHRNLNPGSADSGFMERFYRTRAYYERKWNGDQGRETFERPFDDDRYDLTIPLARVDNPYPDYARTDLL